MLTSPLIELVRVGYRQQGTQILDNVSWSLSARERWAVLGPNGCGKSTLLRIACGYVWPTSGSVRRLGEELLDLRALRRSLGWASSELPAQIPPGERALETVVSGKFAQVGLKALGDVQPTAADFAAARQLLEQMGCDFADKPFGVLSQGERQQTLVARARMVDPLMIVLDEPCAGMDPGVRERFLAWLNDFAAPAEQAAIVFVTHHVEEILPRFDRTLLMQAGRIAAAGPTHEVATAERLAAAYRIKVERIERSGGRLWPIWGADS